MTLDESPLQDPMLRSEADERLNTLTHGFGILLSLVAAITLMNFALASRDVWRIAGCAIYSLSLISVYTCSTLSHAVRRPQAKLRFRLWDQACIYLLIAGTYTPFGLAYLRSGWWLILFITMWAIALYGFISKIFFAYQVNAVAIWLYIIMGWMPIIAVRPLVGIIPSAGLLWMLIGGICYTVGTVFLIHDARSAHFHAVWHMFVIAGSTCQFFPILLFVARLQ